MRTAALHLARARFDLEDRQVLYKDLLRSQGFTGFGALVDAVRLFPQMFKLTRGGFYLKRAINSNGSREAQGKEIRLAAAEGALPAEP